ncbi:flagellar basal-body rod protein FlgB [Halioglobus japonicus]|uniref:Flagellar basal body rod protein FlgB n=1 Tax=Halioglobus japonicus TaxID=930805 RepID=A0AAP8SN38_9GAMM|nr:flagellar basal body rod protein FlgB [Halioglobus japonicus]AQA18079.1 flagellar basal-body rod protein FlgB [Halioglobus japonicus]PLW86071.1 flagellar basal body rod protein FlgB [Halioglobus japonicus]GHD14636.1 flagellar basal body rod protein FlgB [Halioglobus japonicus]
MYDKLNAMFQFHEQNLGLRHYRQTLLANNIANADTPNYKATDIRFSDALSKATDNSHVSRQFAHPVRQVKGHIALETPVQTSFGNSDLLYRIPSQASIDGNSVDIDQERAEFLDNSVRYQAALTLANSYLKGLRTAMQSE